MTKKELEQENGNLKQEIENLKKALIENDSDCGLCQRLKPKWHYIKYELPPQPKEEDNNITALTYICAYTLKNGDREISDFLYIGDGEFMGENKEYPIYAWLDCPVDIPAPLN